MDVLKLYTVAEVCEILRVTPKTLIEWINAGALRAYRHGKIIRIAEKDLKSFMGKAQTGLHDAKMELLEWAEEFAILRDDPRFSDLFAAVDALQEGDSE